MDGLVEFKQGPPTSQVLGASGEVTVTDNGNGTITLFDSFWLKPFHYQR